MKTTDEAKTTVRPTEVAGRGAACGRRELLLGGAAVAGGATLVSKLAGAQVAPSMAPEAPAVEGGYQPVIAPNVPTLPSKIVDGVRVFHLIAEEHEREFTAGLMVKVWGYNGSCPGPLIEAVEGERCRFYVTNRLPEPTTVHWHAIIPPNGMDGVGGLTQAPIPVGETFRYEFVMDRAGTFMYHPHFDEMLQIAFGMTGMIVVHPRRRAPLRRPLRDYSVMLHEWFIPAGTRRPNPLAMSDFNVLTMNGKAFPGTAPLLAETGDLVRIRIGNLSPMNHHPMHLHGHTFRVVATDGGDIPVAAQHPDTTTIVPVGGVRTIEFVAGPPGDWAFHCHMTHHMMNQMGHEIPNMVGASVRGLDQKVRPLLPGYMTMGQTGMAGMGEMDMPIPENSIPMKGRKGPFGYIDMGGMFTIVKVRDKLSGSTDPGWYQHPAGTVARAAKPEELRADGIDPKA